MTCSTVTMNQFLTALLGDTTYVGDHWEDLYNEYVSLRENKQSSYILDLIKEITYLQAKEFIIIKCVQVLAAPVYSRELVMELKQCGCKGRFNFNDLTAYSNDLKAALSFAKKYKGQIERKEKDLQEYRDRHGSEVIDRKFFDDMAITLWRFMGSRVDYDLVTVTEWCSMMNLYERYCEASATNKSADIVNDKKVNVN